MILNVVYISYIVCLSVNGEDLSIAETVSQVTEVRLTSSGGLGKANHCSDKSPIRETLFLFRNILAAPLRSFAKGKYQAESSRDLFCIC